MDPEQMLITVDGQDRPTGVMEKMRAHREGVLHRAFSVFVFDDANRLLLQRRATQKYHSGGLWSNTCCSHPRPGELVPQAAHRRLGEEMGFDCALETAFSFVYRAELDGGLLEHEYDHVLIGRFSGDPAPDPAEVSAWSWESVPDIESRLSSRPGDYTVWFRIALGELVARGLHARRARK